MFRKKSSSTRAGSPASTLTPESNNKDMDNSLKNTVIARNVSIEGNIHSSGQVYIYGELKGDLHATDGQIHVMRGGHVTGNITAPTLIIDGRVNGECHAEKIEIGRHGHVQGVLQYATLTVTTGGGFSGRAEQQCDSEETNVVDFVQDPDPVERSVVPESSSSEIAISK